MNKKVKGTIYCIINTVNSKQYVGQTIIKPEYRMSKHISDALKEKRKTAISTAIRKYGPEKFKMFVLEKVDIEVLNSKEAHWIEILDTYENGYNRLKRSNHDRQEIQLIVEKFVGGETQESLSKKYHIDKGTLKSILEELNIDTKQNHKHSFKKWKEEKIITLYKQGKSIRDISVEVKSCRKTISSILRNNNLIVKKGSPNKYKHPYKRASLKQ